MLGYPIYKYSRLLSKEILYTGSSRDPEIVDTSESHKYLFLGLETYLFLQFTSNNLI